MLGCIAEARYGPRGQVGNAHRSSEEQADQLSAEYFTEAKEEA